MRKEYIMSRFFVGTRRVLILLLALVLLAPIRMFGVGWTPTDGGLVVNLHKGDQFLLSVMVDHDNNPSTPEREYFVENYTRYTGDDYLKYDSTGVFLKLIPQEARATEPSEMSIWTVDTAITRISGKTNYALGGIAYTMWNDKKTLKTGNNTRFKFFGDLTENKKDQDLCDVVFVIPTDYSGVTSFDPNNTMGRGTKFNGGTGTGFLGMTYREVYWLEISRSNDPNSYTNAAVVTFNTTQKDIKFAVDGSKFETAKSGRAYYAFADNKHKPTKRVLFRLYILNEPINSCSGYFFAYDEQTTLRYRQSNTMTDSTARKKIYTMDRLFCMDRVGDTKYYQTGLMNVPEQDSSYYYVGYNDDYRNGRSGSPREDLGSSTAHSEFTRIRELPMKDLPSKSAPAGAYGRMVVDTTSSANNLGVAFEPAGYFLKVSTGTNIRMRKTADNQWTCENVWTITDKWASLKIKATLMTGAEFSETDPGQDIAGWSTMVVGTSVPLANGSGTVTGGMTGWARITTTSTDPNGHLEFVLANGDTCIHYDNNGFHGLQIPDQHPALGSPNVTVEAPRIKSDYTFNGWNTKPDGSGHMYSAGDVINFKSLPDGVSLTNDTLYLYAQGTYNGTYNVALSFIHTDGKRYFLTHPGREAPRYSRARHYDDWTNVWQGMANAENVDPLYLNSFELRHPSNEIKAYQDGMTEEERQLEAGEFVLDPRHYTMKGSVDSLTFYEYFTPGKDEYLGLYYKTGLNTILANNSWAGLFKSTSRTTSTGWPDYKEPYIHNTKLYSTRYVLEEDSVNHPDSLTLMIRENNASGTYVKYIPATNQFDGCVNPDTATMFDISAIVVADEHYVVLPDTTVSWRNDITFDYHQNKQLQEQVQSRLIGKQLMACMMVGGDTTYFHPNRNKVYNTAQELNLSVDFRLSQSFTFIPDARVASALDEEDKVSMSDTEDNWSYQINSGKSSPMNIKVGGEYSDIVDTIRIRLSQGVNSKIKEFRGRWKTNADDRLKVSKDGSRYRDIYVTTKTYHYADTITRLVLTPEFDSYTFNPLKDDSRTINFTLTKVRTRKLKDSKDNDVDEEPIDTIDVTSSLALVPSACTLSSKEIHFKIPVDGVVSRYVTVLTTDTNKTDDNLDTLKISMNVTIDAVEYPVTANVPLLQTSLEGDELIWSVYYGSQRYYIMAGTDGLIFRTYKQSGSSLYKEGSNNTPLVKGSANAKNDDTKYITPWHFRYNPLNANQLSLKTEYGVDRYLKMLGDAVGAAAGIHDRDSSFFTFKYVNVYTNTNANEEEQVKLQYGADKWLKFSKTGSTYSLKLVDKEDSASVFSWSYLLQEHSLLNNGTYPSRESVTFGYNTNMNVNIQTRYKAYKEFSMLVGNNVVYLCREDENSIAHLISDGLEWKTNYSIARIPDARDFDAGSVPNPAVSGLSYTLDSTSLTTKVSTSGATTSPTNVKIGGKYVNIVDTLHVTISLDGDAPEYRFKDKWSSFKSVDDAELKIPLIRKTYHTDTYDSIVCTVEDDEYNFTFPNTITDPVSHTFTFGTERRQGKHVLDVDNTTVAVLDATAKNITKQMKLGDKDLAEVRLVDEYGKTPDWCRIPADGKGDSTITVVCTKSGIRSPRTAYMYLAYIVTVEEGKIRFVNFRVTVSQPSLYQYANNQHLVHSRGASGDPLNANGMQQVHENTRILYYYPDQNVELPVRESHFFGWWRWYREGAGEIGDSDIPDSLWRTKPRNVGNYNYPFRIIGDSVWEDESDHSKGKKLVTMGRYTVFHYRSSQYNDVRNNPPCKTALVAPPTVRTGIPAKPTDTFAVDISNYYDRLPMSVSQKNQVDTARLDTMRAIPEPTLSLREVFVLRPWTEMADTMDHYKTRIPGDNKYPNDKYMEDHVVMAPLNNQLLLSTEQRYNKANLDKHEHSESLLCYYMHDDNWAEMSDIPDDDGWSRKDSMIWCGGWDADCLWYTYDPKTQEYTSCTHKITEENDFLIVPGKDNIPAGKDFDTIYYCLRAQSRKSPVSGPDPEEPEPGDYMFNICRYMIIYHNPGLYGPKLETTTNGVTKALITDDEIEQNYEVLERLNFDYNKPGSEYQVYPHPLPWADASYGYTYPETSDLPHNRLHTQSDFPNMGEYGLINRIPDKSHWNPSETYWYAMEQHGGAANGYMIYCDGMSSAGQVAALSLNTQLCEGQKMYFSGYVGNCSNQSNKSKPNFTFSVQGSADGSKWDDITSYMTGELPTSSKWYQIYFPINLNNNRADGKAEYTHFRVRIYNVASNWDGNDFVIDDMCLFATKPPLIAYQANTQCVENSTNDSITQVVLRIDYQGFSNEDYNGQDILYTVEMEKGNQHSYVPMEDGYLNQEFVAGQKTPVVTPDTIYGIVHMPTRTYEPSHEDSIYANLNDLILRFDTTTSPKYKQGYIYENVDGVIRPVMYVVHVAKMTPDNTYHVRMSTTYRNLLSSICAMTSKLEVTSQMMLELNGEEQPGKEVVGMCANTTYDISMRVKGSLYLDNAAPIDLDGSCQNDWLMYGDTAEDASLARYGYKYQDIVKVIKDILRCDPKTGTNSNQFVSNFSSVSRNEMIRIQKEKKVELTTGVVAYDLLDSLVSKGLLIMYKAKLTATLMTGDSLQYVVFPIVGTGSDAMHNAKMDVCPNPMLIKLKPENEGAVPLILGGVERDATQTAQPIGILANTKSANERLVVRIDSIASRDVSTSVAIHSIELRSTDDPNYLEGIHTLQLMPDKEWIVGKANDDYYVNGDSLYMRPSEYNNYRMRGGYTYTFIINLMKRSDGSLTMTSAENSCRVGTVPFTVSVVPDFIRWEPKNKENSAWNNPDNWIGINNQNKPLHDEAHFAPLASSQVIIPTMEDGMPYPVLPDTSKLSSREKIKQIGFEYNTCDVIRFMPGAALAQQQRMNYNEAVVDMTTPQGKWALRSTPVTGLLGGDIFMANADLNNVTSLWEVGAFDASGRNNTTGNASFWISLFNSSVIQKGNGQTVNDTTLKASAQWSKSTNNMKLSLPPASGWAIFTRTVSEKDAVVRLPKKDDIYYYFDSYGEIQYEIYEQYLQAERDTAAGGAGKAGKLAFRPDGDSQDYSLTNSVASRMFVFGNPTMGYIDIWGFIDDNGLSEEFDYINASGSYVTISKTAAEDETTDTISELQRYLPPMHAIVIKTDSVTSKSVTLNTKRIVTSHTQVDRSSTLAPKRISASGLSKGIMKVTALNPVSSRCISRLLIGQGYHNAVREGEDAILTTVNIDNYTNTSAPATPFNIYASEGKYGLSIDLRDEVMNIPISFYMSNLPYDPVTQLWFTGVNNIDGELVFYDALTGSEQKIVDGICITIPTPEQSHEARYYIRRRGFNPDDTTSPITTEVKTFEMDGASAVKIIKDGHVFILRDGHVYSMFGQKLR